MENRRANSIIHVRVFPVQGSNRSCCAITVRNVASPEKRFMRPNVSITFRLYNIVIMRNELPKSANSVIISVDATMEAASQGFPLIEFFSRNTEMSTVLTLLAPSTWRRCTNASTTAVVCSAIVSVLVEVRKTTSLSHKLGDQFDSSLSTTMISAEIQTPKIEPRKKSITIPLTTMLAH